MTNEQKLFINTLYPLIKKYAGNDYCPACIMAQAILESAWGKSKLASYNNFFGMKTGRGYKGKSINFSTKEEKKDGSTYTIKANFRAYDSVENGIAGYFDFISAKRYSNLKKSTDYKTYAINLKEDGWATSSAYTDSLVNITEKYLLSNDNDTTKDALSIVAEYVKAGYYGNGNNARSNQIYSDVAFRSIRLLKNNVESTSDLDDALYTLAKQCIDGVYGVTESEKRKNLYDAIRKKVNGWI